MKALRFHKFGSPSVLAIEEVPRPEPHDGEALIQVQAAAINPSDVKNVSGNFPATTLPRTPGRDFAGIVVTGKKYEGQEVWGSGPGLGTTRDGAQAEYVVVSEEAVSPKPRNLSFEQAAAIGVPFITAWCAVVDAAQLINTTTDDLRRRVFELTDNKGADAVFDTVGGAMFEPSLRCLRVGGRQIAITSTGERRVCFDLIDFYHNLSRLVGVDTMKLTPRDVAAIAQNLCSGFEAGALKPPAVETRRLKTRYKLMNDLSLVKQTQNRCLHFDQSDILNLSTRLVYAGV
jgi:NADPH:quinone reductase-like Zn-dependent oxidoreductase